MVEEYHRSLRRGVGHHRIQPGQTPVRHHGRSHAHIRAAVAAQELDSALLEVEMLVAEGLFKGIAAALGPLGVVVARHYPVGHAESVQRFLGGIQFAVRAEVGDVSAYQHEIHVPACVDAVYAVLQLREAGRAFAQVEVRHIRETDGAVTAVGVCPEGGAAQYQQGSQQRKRPIHFPRD